jgi:hypothetical protein
MKFTFQAKHKVYANYIFLNMVYRKLYHRFIQSRKEQESVYIIYMTLTAWALANIHEHSCPHHFSLSLPTPPCLKGLIMVLLINCSKNFNGKAKN